MNAITGRAAEGEAQAAGRGPLPQEGDLAEELWRAYRRERAGRVPGTSGSVKYQLRITKPGSIGVCLIP
ncbi:MAG: hypothetical protein ACJAZN_003652 [Planctomycetota bacterium]|jgi:hypothetical protein